MASNAKKWDRERVVRFLEHQGFYIVIIVCLAVIAATALMTRRLPAPAPELSLDNGPPASGSQLLSSLSDVQWSAQADAPALPLRADALADLSNRWTVHGASFRGGSPASLSPGEWYR